MVHDFGYLAVESEAGLSDALYGRVARGVPYASLGDVADAPEHDGRGLESWHVERIVGPLQTAARKGVEPAAFVAGLRGYLAAIGAPGPERFDEGLVARALARLRELDGRWRSTPCGATLELRSGG